MSTGDTVLGPVERIVRPAAKAQNVRYTTPVMYDGDEERTECECREPQDNDRRVCMDCGRWIAYRSRA